MLLKTQLKQQPNSDWIQEEQRQWQLNEPEPVGPFGSSSESSEPGKLLSDRNQHQEKLCCKNVNISVLSNTVKTSQSTTIITSI